METWIKNMETWIEQYGNMDRKIWKHGQNNMETWIKNMETWIEQYGNMDKKYGNMDRTI